MAKGASIKLISYKETVPKILDLLKLERELKKYDKIVLKPNLTDNSENSVSVDFVEAVLKFVVENKNPVAEIFIAEGADGSDTEELFESQGYKKLAERYDVGLIDLNTAETEEVISEDFLRFTSITYPRILSESAVISISKLCEDEETGIRGTLSNMLGAFPSSKYSGFFFKGKNKIRKWPIEYSVHDIVKCKMPAFSIVDASSKGMVLAGLPIEIDAQMARMLNKNSNDVPYLDLFEKSSVERTEEESIPNNLKILKETN